MICPDYDNDCKKVEYPERCFFGGGFIENGIKYELEMSQGYCPLLKSEKHILKEERQKDETM